MDKDSISPALIAALYARTQALAASLHDRSDQASALRAVRNVADLRADVDALLSALVDDARRNGSTWQEVGQILGISRQAAYQRFGQATDPRTGKPLAKELFDGSSTRAVNVFDLLRQGRGDEVYDDFDQIMKQAMSPAQLGDVWAHVLTQVGSFESSGAPNARRMADLTVVDVPLHFEAGEMIGRVAFREDGPIAGLFILEANAVPGAAS